MSRADELFIQNCKDILENGIWDTDRPVRTRWDDGTPESACNLPHLESSLGMLNGVTDLSRCPSAE